MSLINGAQFVVATRARGHATIGRRAETAKVQILDLGIVDVRGQLRFRETGPPGAGDCTDVDEQIDGAFTQGVEKGLYGRNLIAYRRDRWHEASPRPTDVISNM